MLIIMEFEFLSMDDMEQLIRDNLGSFPLVAMGSTSVNARADELLGLYELPTDTVIVNIHHDRTFFGIMQTLTHETIHSAVKRVAGEEAGFAVDLISKINVPLFITEMGGGID